MSLMAPISGGSDFEIAPEGMHVARCTRVIDQGHQEVTFSGTTKIQPKVWVMWELPNVERKYIDKEQNEQTGCAVISQRYTRSAHQKAKLRMDTETWFGKKLSDKDVEDMGGIDMRAMLDKPAYINVVHSTDGKYANIGSINPVPAEINVPERVGELIYLELTKEGYKKDVFEALSPRMQETIMKSDEWQNVSGNEAKRFPVPGDPGHRDESELVPF